LRDLPNQGIHFLCGDIGPDRSDLIPQLKHKFDWQAVWINHAPLPVPCPDRLFRRYRRFGRLGLLCVCASPLRRGLGRIGRREVGIGDVKRTWYVPRRRGNMPIDLLKGWTPRRSTLDCATETRHEINGRRSSVRPRYLLGIWRRPRSLRGTASG
jgi:hypothetical protein